MSDTKKSPSTATRREFIKTTGTTAAVVAATGLIKTPVYGQTQAPSANVVGANERLAIGYIGVGGQGFNAHVRQMREHAGEHNII